MKYPLTVDEATRIRDLAHAGVLDLRLPGTAGIVRDAERTCARAELWGATRRDRAQSAFVVSVITVTIVAITFAALAVPVISG